MDTPVVTPDHGTILMVAWGMVEGKVPKEVRIKAKREAIAAGIIIASFKKTAEKNRLWGREVVSVVGDRVLNHTKRMAESKRPLLCTGSLQECCRRALSEIDPINYPVTPEGNTP